MFIFYDYESSESFQIYSALIITMIIFIFIIFSDMKKLKNIIIFIILNLNVLLMPGSIAYLFTIYYSEVINKSYIQYILNYLSEGGYLVWLLPTVLLNSNSIFLFILEYKKLKYNV